MFTSVLLISIYYPSAPVIIFDLTTSSFYSYLNLPFPTINFNIFPKYFWTNFIRVNLLDFSIVNYLNQKSKKYKVKNNIIANNI